MVIFSHHDNFHYGNVDNELGIYVINNATPYAKAAEVKNVANCMQLLSLKLWKLKMPRIAYLRPPVYLRRQARTGRQANNANNDILRKVKKRQFV